MVMMTDMIHRDSGGLTWLEVSPEGKLLQNKSKQLKGMMVMMMINYIYPIVPMLSISVRYEIKCMCVFQCSLDQKQFLCSVSDKTTPTI